MTHDRPVIGVRHVLIALAVSIVVIVGGLVGAYALDTAGEPTTIRRLEIHDRPAGDLTRPELRRLLSRVRHAIEAQEIHISFPEEAHVLIGAELGLTLDDEAVEEAAFAAGEAASGWLRFRRWLGSLTRDRQIPLTLSLDRNRARQMIGSLDGVIVADPVEPRLVLDAEQALTVEPGVAGRRVDVDATVDRLEHQVAAGGPFRVDAPTVALRPSIEDSVVAELADELNRATAGGITVEVAGEERSLGAVPLRLRLDVEPAQDGSPVVAFDLDSLQRLVEDTFGEVELAGADPVFDVVDERPVVVEEGEPPLRCCRDDAARLVAEAVLDGGRDRVRVEPTPAQDPRLVEWARGEGVVEKVAEFTTEHPCCEARVTNIQRFADIIRGAYLTPGESLSLNDYVGERTRERGFVPAGTIIRGHLVPTVGGGVSQFATTIFNAAFFAGFDFVTYQSHSLYISRYPYGREATISWPAPDLEFTNTTDYPALIWTSYTDTSITVSIYSTRSIVVEETRQEVSSVRQCTRVETYRSRTYEDGTQVEDSVFATYRPGEGLDCNGDPTDRPDL